MVFLGIDEVRADVVLHHHGHQAGGGAAHAGDEVHNLLAARLRLERTLDGLDLPADAAHARE